MSISMFDIFALTNAINKLQYAYGEINESGLFAHRGVRDRTIRIEERDQILRILPTQPVGAPGTQQEKGKRKIRSIAIPHIPYDSVALPQDIDGLRAFGSETQLQTMARELTSILADMKANVKLTWEYHKAHALQGKVLDADGSLLYDLFDVFDITQKEVDFALGEEGTTVRNKCIEVTRHIEKALMGAGVGTGIRAKCHSDFFDALISHPSVEKVYLNHAAAIENLAGDPRKGFRFGGIVFEDYVAEAPDEANNVVPFIESGTCAIYPSGARGLFQAFFAPGDFNETVNTVGLDIYAKIEPRKHNRGYDLHVQTNPCFVCFRPGALVKGVV